MRRFNFIESPYTGARVRITSKNKKIGKTMKQDSKKNKRQNKMQVIDKTAILKHKIELRLRRWKHKIIQIMGILTKVKYCLKNPSTLKDKAIKSSKILTLASVLKDRAIKSSKILTLASVLKDKAIKSSKILTLASVLKDKAIKSSKILTLASVLKDKAIHRLAQLCKTFKTLFYVFKLVNNCIILSLKI